MNITVQSRITEPRRSRSAAHTFDWIIRNRPARRPKSFPSPWPRDDVNLQFKLHFRVSRYNWGLDARRGTSRNCATARTEVMVRADRDSCQIDLAPSTKFCGTHPIAMTRTSVRGRRAALAPFRFASFGLSSITSATIPPDNLRM